MTFLVTAILADYLHWTARDEPIENGNASVFWYKAVIQFGFGVIEYIYTSSGFALGHVYSLTLNR